MNRTALPLLCLCLCPLARAQDDKQQLTAIFERLDTKKDGKLDRSEFPGSDRQFAAIDKNKDGFLDLEEFVASDQARRFLASARKDAEEARPRATAASLALARLELIARSDKNHDGKVTREEWTGTAEAFEQLDLDRNGVLDRRDRALAAAEAVPAEPAWPEMRDPLPSVEEILVRYDKDKNGMLSMKEVAGNKFLAEVFSRADTNGDKQLDAKELRYLGDKLRTMLADRQHSKSKARAFQVPFDEWDKNKDGRIEQNEWQGNKALFERIDLDRDAAITREEVQRYKKRVEGDDFVDRFDLNGDGRVTLEEFGGPPEAFRRADKNGDGVVTRADR
jgi:Ca2+-binding EF-hand superfamily protein